MPEITDLILQKNNKNKVNVYVDGEYSFAISYESILKNRIKKGSVLSDNELVLLQIDNQKALALEKAISYVSKTIKTKKQVYDYLAKKGFADDCIYYCIDKLKEYKYIDDKEYAKRYIESVKNQGKRLLEYKLRAKGIKQDDFETAFNEVNPNQQSNAYEVCKKYLKNKELTKENLSKAYRYLIGRGFSYEDVDNAIRQFKDED